MRLSTLLPPGQSVPPKLSAGAPRGCPRSRSASSHPSPTWFNAAAPTLQNIPEEIRRITAALSATAERNPEASHFFWGNWHLRILPALGLRQTPLPHDAFCCGCPQSKMLVLFLEGCPGLYRASYQATCAASSLLHRAGPRHLSLFASLHVLKRRFILG